MRRQNLATPRPRASAYGSSSADDSRRRSPIRKNLYKELDQVPHEGSHLFPEGLVIVKLKDPLAGCAPHRST
jgi:hypothetical protein